MKEKEHQTDPRLKVLVVVAGVFGLLAAHSIVHSIRMLSEPVMDSTIQVDAAPRRQARAMPRPAKPPVQRIPWQPTTKAQQQQAALSSKESVSGRFQFAQINEFEAKQAAQMTRLRQDLAQNAGDDLDATPSEEEIASMQKEGVMIW